LEDCLISGRQKREQESARFEYVGVGEMKECVGLMVESKKKISNVKYSFIFVT
jgi:hypothetical protein